MATTTTLAADVDANKKLRCVNSLGAVLSCPGTVKTITMIYSPVIGESVRFKPVRHSYNGDSKDYTKRNFLLIILSFSNTCSFSGRSASIYVEGEIVHRWFR